MPNYESEPLQRIHVALYEADVAKLHALFDNNIGFTKGIRTVLRDYLLRIEERAERNRALAKQRSLGTKVEA